MKKIAIIVLLIFTAPSAFSQEIQLEQYKGKVVYLDFWASWCGPCKKSFPWMNQLKKELDPNSFVIVAVNLDKEKNLADEFLKENHAEFDIVFDPQAVNAKKFKVKGMPSSYLIDQSGKVIGSHVGFREEEAPAMKQRIIKLIKEGKK